MTEPGIEFLDHTADVGIDVTAPDLRTLFDRAALGLLALLYGREDLYADAQSAAYRPPFDDQESAGESAGAAVAGSGEDGAESTMMVEIEGRDRAELLARWLKELLFFHEVRGVDYRSARFEQLERGSLRARVVAAPAGSPVREIKGVTYHGLEVTETDHGWAARVIFDV